MKKLDLISSSNFKLHLNLGKITLFLTVLTFYSCGNEVKSESKSTKTEQVAKKENFKDSKRAKELEKLNYFYDNPSLTDENGITYDLRVKDEEVNRRKVYESERTYYRTKYDEIYIVVSAYHVENEYKLYSNGELKGAVKVKGYFLESKRSDRNGFDQFCSDKFSYFPELSSEKTKKTRIADFTGANCGMGEEVNNKVRNARIKAVQTSGILSNQEIDPVEKVVSTPVVVKPKVADSENTEKPEVSTLKITVDNLRVRTSPNLDAEKLENLPIDSEVVFLNEKSTEKTTVTIDNGEIEAFWYKIKTPSGKIGWIHGCCFEKN